MDELRAEVKQEKKRGRRNWNYLYYEKKMFKPVWLDPKLRQEQDANQVQEITWLILAVCFLYATCKTVLTTEWNS